jgi:hypothetical protein
MLSFLCCFNRAFIRFLPNVAMVTQTQKTVANIHKENKNKATWLFVFSNQLKEEAVDPLTIMLHWKE